MSRFVARLTLFLGLRARSAPAPELMIHRGERELCAGTATLGVVSTPVAKLSAEEASRCFGIRLVNATSDDALRRYSTRLTFADEVDREP